MASVRQLPDPSKKTGKRPWVVEYTDRGGKRRRATPKSGLKRDADKLRLKIETEIEAGHHLAPSQTITVSQAIDLWLERCEERVKANDHLRPRTLAVWKGTANKHIRPALGRMLVTDVTANHVQSFVDGMSFGSANKVGRPTIIHIVNFTRYILEDARRRQYLKQNVLVGARIRIPGKPAKPIKVPTKEQVRDLLQASGQASQGGPAPYLKTFLHVAIFGGLRLGEIRALQWENVDLAGGVIRVREGMDRTGRADEPKSRAGVRDIPIAKPLLAELMRWKMACGRPETGLLFKGREGGHVQEGALQQSWRRLQHRVFRGEAAGVERPMQGFHFHALRHVAASLLIETGLPPKRIQAIMGHASIQMTFDRYGHLFDDPDLVREAMGRMGGGVIA